MILRLRTTLLVSIFIAVSLYAWIPEHLRPIPVPGASWRIKDPSSANQPFTTELKSFWQSLVDALEDARPTCSPLEVDRSLIHDQKYEPLDFDKHQVEWLKDFTDVEELQLFRAHYKMRNSAMKLGRSLPYIPESTGIVTTAGGKYIPILMVSLRMLRKTGCKLPVEVYLDSPAEYNSTICEEILPSMNARCRIISDIYETAFNAVPPDHYQYKVLSMLFSSFQNILFLDADAFPAHDPTPLFENAPFTTHGLVTWPDFWSTTTSSHFYHIAGIPTPPPAQRRAAESGQLLLDKSKHRESLLMMAYYNYFGPEYYYLLLTQGGPGTGDKDTFIPAAMSVDAPFYQVKQGIRVLGHWNTREEGKFQVAAMAQADPIADFLYKVPHPSHIHEKEEWTKEDLGEEIGEINHFLGGRDTPLPPKPRQLFIHCSPWKLDPAKVLDPEGKAFDKDENPIRAYSGNDGDKHMMEAFGYDMEKRVWQSIGEEACRMDPELCSRVVAHYEALFGEWETSGLKA